MTSSEPGEPAASGDVLDRVAEAIALLESHPQVEVREAARTLLEGIDAVHRAGLTQMVQAIRSTAGDAFLNRLLAEPPIRLLLMSYGLIAVDRRLQAEEAVDSVRGHLHDHGIDVEILEVVGGVVYVHLHPNGHAAESIDPSAAAIQDLQAALRAHFIGFQELVPRAREAAAPPSQFVSLDGLRRAHRPVYQDVLALDELPPGTIRSARIDDVPILCANIEGEIYAIRNECGESPLPLEFGSLTGAELKCSWHGCRYDVRSGRRVDGDAGRVQTFPVAVKGTSIRIAVGVTGAESGR